MHAAKAMHPNALALTGAVTDRVQYHRYLTQVRRQQPGHRPVADAGRRRHEDLKVNRTTGFFVNGTPLRDFGEAQLKALVDQEVAKAKLP